MQHQSNIALRILRMQGLKTKTHQSASSLYDIQNPRSPRFDPTFPKRVHLGQRTVGWFEHEVDAWLLSRQNTAFNLAIDEHSGVAK